MSIRTHFKSLHVFLGLLAVATGPAHSQWITPFVRETNEVFIALRLNTGVLYGPTDMLPSTNRISSARIVRLLKQVPDKNIDHRWREGTTYLQAASYWGNAKVCQTLLAKGADPNVRDRTGRTALHYAVVWNDCEFGLCDEGAECVELQKGKHEVTKLLLKAGCDVNVRDMHGDTPLHWAVRTEPMHRDDLPMLIKNVETLLGSHADVNSTNSTGLSPMDLFLHKDFGSSYTRESLNTNLWIQLRNHGALQR